MSTLVGTEEGEVAGGEVGGEEVDMEAGEDSGEETGEKQESFLYRTFRLAHWGEPERAPH